MDELKHEMYAGPEDATNLPAFIKSEPGMHCDYTFVGRRRLVDVFWSIVEQRKQRTRYGSCIEI